ncbi:hypothetical protein KP509_36G058800 [Ceratopteris richardii]|uniref:Pentatricopeptide repeat-containing protein n=1 Tax=Ceratopteris richardii TaxID=49495 RepID=A0A8T2QDM0_CERRI|nr:hypothetical protein KP509_36G058800 [Ceratopteris richardii]
MYAKCGDFSKAQDVLQNLPFRDIVAWNALIAGYVQQSQNKEAIRCFEEMQSERLSPDEVTFVCILNACGELQNIDKGKEIHHEIVRQGLLGTNIEIDIAVVNMYSKCGRLEIVQEVLDDLVKDAVVWSTLVARYVQQDKADAALNCFDLMEQKGLSPDEMTFIHTLKACGCLRMVEKGIQIHGEVVRQGLLDKNVALCTTLIDMYTKCGVLSKAQDVLQNLPFRNIVAWNALIAGYVQQSQNKEAIRCFEEMQSERLSPDEVTFVCILNACGELQNIDKGKEIHHEIVRQGLLGTNIEIDIAVVNMYSKCGILEIAQEVLDDLVKDAVVWSTLVARYVQQDKADAALNCFDLMEQKGLSPDEMTFIHILKACGCLRMVEKGIQIHSEVVRQGLLDKNVALCTTLIDMYTKCGVLSRKKMFLMNSLFHV